MSLSGSDLPAGHRHRHTGVLSPWQQSHQTPPGGRSGSAGVNRDEQSQILGHKASSLSETRAAVECKLTGQERIINYLQASSSQSGCQPKRKHEACVPGRLGLGRQNSSYAVLLLALKFFQFSFAEVLIPTVSLAGVPSSTVKVGMG